MTQPIDGNAIRRDYLAWHDANLIKFSMFWKTALENIGLKYDEHWGKDVISKWQLANRVPLNMPMIFQAIQAIEGFEKTNRNSIFADSDDPDDELNVEIANHVIKKILKDNKYKYLRDEIFDDGLVACYGAMQAYAEKDEYGFNKICIERIPYNRIMFDLNFKDYGLKDCTRKQYFEWKYLDDVIIEFPKKEEELRTAGNRNTDDGQTYPVRSIEDYYTNYIGSDGEKIGDKWIIKLIHDYKKVNKTVYELHNISNGDVDEYSEKQDAETEQQRIYNEYLQQAQQINTVAGQAGIVPSPVLPIEQIIPMKPVLKKRIEYTCGTYNTILSKPELLEDEEDGFFFYFAMFKDGKWWTLVDILKSCQQEYDKNWAQLDYSIGTDVKTTFGMDVTKLHPSNTPEQAAEKMAKGGVIFTQGNPSELVNPIQAHGANPAYFQLMEGIKMDVQDATGGKQFQGLPDPSNTTKGGIELLQAAGTMQSSNYLTALERFDELFGEYLLRLIQKNYSYEKTIKILGNELTDEVKQVLSTNGYYKAATLDPNKGFLTINPQGKKPLNASNFSVEVISKDARFNDKQYKLNALTKLAQEYGMVVPPDIICRLLGLEPTEIQRITKATEDAQKAQQQQQETQNKIEAGKALGDNISKIAGATVSKGANEKKTPSQSISFKDIPPEAQSQMLAEVGIHMNADEIQQHRDEQAQKEQANKPNNTNGK